MKIAIIDYGSGNLRSVAKSFERAAREAEINADIIVTSRPDDVAAADRIVLPGVGAFADCRRGLLSIDGLEDALESAVRSAGRPFFGICVGMQLMASRGFEHGETSGLGWIAGQVRAIQPADPALKIPHMGWNALSAENVHPLLAGLDRGRANVYFVHAYHFIPEVANCILATCHYGSEIVAAVGVDNMFGTQFHPEKSQKAGLQVIANFLRWGP